MPTKTFDLSGKVADALHNELSSYADATFNEGEEDRETNALIMAALERAKAGKTTGEDAAFLLFHIWQARLNYWECPHCGEPVFDNE